MECEFGNSICDVIASVIDVAKSGFPWLEARWEEIHQGNPKADKLLGPLTAGTKQLFDPLRPHLEAIFGLVGLSFAIWRWYRHREKVLHKRLLEYLLDEEKRLGTSLEGMLEAIDHPTTRRRPRSPLLVSRALRKVLKRKNWKGTSIFTSVEHTTETQLVLAGVKVGNQLELLEKAKAGYREQQAAVHILAGAIKSARAAKYLVGRDEQRQHAQALESFRYALDVEGQSANLMALEYKADQERLLGSYDSALATYEELELRASQTSDLKKKFLTIAKSRRRRAQILMSP